jgi:hypothetical protein
VPESGLSPSEVGKEIGEHRHRHAHDEQGAMRWVAVGEALLLAIVAVIAAWSGYSSAKWGTESRLLLAEASTARTEAGTAQLEADEQREFDQLAFSIWFTAYVSGDAQAVALAESVFTPEMAEVTDAWLAADPVNNPDVPPGPTAMPGYDEPRLDDAEELNAGADERFREGSEAGVNADEYVRTTLYLATVLFLVGISGHFRLRGARIGLVTVGLAITVFAAVQIIGLPTPPG